MAALTPYLANRLIEEVFYNVDEIFNNQRLSVSVKSNLKAGLVTGAATTIGGFLLGPLGLIAGAAIGSLSMASSQAAEGIESPLKILLDLSAEEKQRIIERLMHKFNTSPELLSAVLSSNVQTLLPVAIDIFKSLGYVVNKR